MEFVSTFGFSNTAVRFVRKRGMLPTEEGETSRWDTRDIVYYYFLVKSYTIDGQMEK